MITDVGSWGVSPIPASVPGTVASQPVMPGPHRLLGAEPFGRPLHAIPDGTMIGRIVDVAADLDRVRVRAEGRIVADHDRVWARG